jgi:hypothetical protein
MNALQNTIESKQYIIAYYHIFLIIKTLTGNDKLPLSNYIQCSGVIMRSETNISLEILIEMTTLACTDIVSINSKG